MATIKAQYDFERQGIRVNGCPPALVHLYQDQPPPAGAFFFHATHDAVERSVQQQGPTHRILYRCKTEGLYVVVKHDTETGETAGRIVGETEAAKFRRKMPAHRQLSLVEEEQTLLEAIADEHPTTLTRETLADKTRLSVRTVGKYLATLRKKGLTHRPNGQKKGEGITDRGLAAIGR